MLCAARGAVVCPVDAPTHLDAGTGLARSIASCLPLTLLPAAPGGQLAPSWIGLGAPRAAGNAELAAGAARAALRVRFLYASPLVAGPGPAHGKVMSPIRWQEESAAVQDAFQRCRGTAGGSLVVSVATLDVLSQIGSEAPAPGGGRDWWHISAHCDSDTGQLVFEDGLGAAHLLPTAALGVALRRPPLGAVLLACSSEQAGRRLVEGGVAFVLATAGPILDSTALLFTTHFYRLLFAGLTEAARAPPAALERAAVRGAFEAALALLRSAPGLAPQTDADSIVLLEGPGVRGFPDDAPAPGPGRSPPDWTSFGRLPSSASSVGPGRSAAWAAATGEEPCGALEDCEDFVGRSWELLWLLRQLGATGGRRVVVLHGAWGSGKSALAAEFRRFAAAPGRRFSDVRAPGGEGREKRLAFVSLRGAGGAGAEATARRLLQAAAAGLCWGSPAESACLVVDQAEEHFGWRDALAVELLQGSPWLHLLLVRRQPLYRLEGTDRWKPQNFGLPPLSSDEGARLFLRRVHRPLTELDFDSTAPGQHLPGAPLSRDVLIPRLADHPLIIACLGNPRRLVNLAARVTCELPSVRDLVA